MPAVLTEVGFMSNPNDLKILVTAQGQQQLAQRLCDAFSSYKKDYELGTATVPIPTDEPKVNNEPNTNKIVTQNKEQQSKSISTNDFYTIQILSVTKLLKSNAPDLKGRKDAKYIKVGNIYKYYIGNYKTRAEANAALNNLRRTFKGAFVIHIKDNKIIK